ncbi:MAG: Mov34/MPN/PAD-1 family protein [Pyrinomonadaceae bacterium]
MEQLLSGSDRVQSASSTPFIGHRIAKERFDPVESILYEYVLAGNGVVLKAHRDEFTVSVPLAYREIKGLPEAFVGIKWHKPRVPGHIWDDIRLHVTTHNSKDDFKEELYLIYWDKVWGSWQWCTSGRDRTWASTIADDRRSEYSEACIEVHTHPPGAYQFSTADDRDESGKFRIFGIIVDVHDKPKVRFRCGIYDHLIPIPFSWIGHLPSGVVDLNEVEALLQMML